MERPNSPLFSAIVLTLAFDGEGYEAAYQRLPLAPFLPSDRDNSFNKSGGSPSKLYLGAHGDKKQLLEIVADSKLTWLAKNRWCPHA